MFGLQRSTIYPVQRELYPQTLGGGFRWSPTDER
jgi:hypothetical protein